MEISNADKNKQNGKDEIEEADPLGQEVLRLYEYADRLKEYFSEKVYLMPEYNQFNAEKRLARLKQKFVKAVQHHKMLKMELKTAM